MSAAAVYRRALAVLFLGLAIPAGAADGGVTIRDGRLDRSDGVYFLSLGVDVQLSDAAREALDNGVPLVLRVEVEVRRARWWWWDETIRTGSRGFRLRYHALSERYLVTRLGSRDSRSFRTLQAALAQLAEMRDLPVIEVRRLRAGEQYLARARAGLDLDALPRPLRAVAYISPSWRLISEWRTWRLDS